LPQTTELAPLAAVTKVVGVPESVGVMLEEGEPLEDDPSSPQEARIEVNNTTANNLPRFFWIDIIHLPLN
jgi:hypothetical protein